MADEDKRLEDLTVDELRELAASRNVDIPSGSLKADIVALLGGDHDRGSTRGGEGSGEDVGQAEVQANFDEINAKGYVGTVPDPTPNYNYTVAGNDEPTPETDDDLAAEARKASGLRG